MKSRTGPRQWVGHSGAKHSPSQWDPNPCLSPLPSSLRAKETESHREEVAGPGPESSGHRALACALGIRRSHWRPPWPSPCRCLSKAPPGPSGPFCSFHSFTFNNFDIWKSAPTPTHNSRRQAAQASGEDSPFISVPSRPLCPHWAPGDTVEIPTTLSATDPAGREQGSSCLWGQAQPQPGCLVKDTPWGRKTRAHGQEARC